MHSALLAAQCSLLIDQGVPRLVSCKGRKIEYAKAAEKFKCQSEVDD